MYGRFWPAVSMAETRVPLASKMYENIEKVLVEEGEVVKEGQELLRYRDRVVTARVGIARADVETSRAELARARERVAYFVREYKRLLGIMGSANVAECDVHDWERMCKQLSAHKSPPLERLWGMLNDRTRELAIKGADQALSMSDRASFLEGLNVALRQKGFYNPAVFEGMELPEEAQKFLRDGVPSVEWKLNRLNRLLVGVALPEALVPCDEGGYVSESDVDRAYFQMRDSESELEQLNTQLKSRQAALDYYVAQAEEYVIKSPLDGVVSRLWVAPGQTVREGQQLVEVIDPSIVKIHVLVPERYVQELMAGQAVKVRFTEFDLDREFDGKISVVAPDISAATRLFQVTVLVEPGEPGVKPGAACEVKFAELIE